jgi:hypothetical protein
LHKELPEDSGKHLENIQLHAVTEADDADEDSDSSTYQSTGLDDTNTKAVPLAADTIAVQSSQEEPDVDK